MNEEYERLLSELTRRGFRFEFEPDCATASRVTSAGGNALDYPTPEEPHGSDRSRTVASAFRDIRNAARDLSTETP
jgi:hypothetical protein